MTIKSSNLSIEETGAGGLQDSLQSEPLSQKMRERAEGRGIKEFKINTYLYRSEF